MNNINSVNDIQRNILGWFSTHGRHWIPWKLNQDRSLPKSGESISPYGIWIAEIMLQQTQLKVVMPYWKKWMKTFPNLKVLADGDENDVLLEWQGLGYYSRAKRIFKSSKILINLIGQDQFLDPLMWPVELDAWMTLPGVGRTTAGSIISSAFDMPAPILDGNVKRILSRLDASNTTPRSDERRLWKLSSQLLPINNPRNFNQALMDLGSLVCTIRNPSCCSCPLQNYCLAYIKYDPNNFPKKDMKQNIPTKEIGIGIVFNKQGKLLIDQRPEGSNMGGMWEFPGGKKESSESIPETIEREINEELGIEIKVGKKLVSFTHAYSHMKLHFTVHICTWISGIPKPLASKKVLWVAPTQLCDFPFPAANTKIIKKLDKYLAIEK